MRKNCIRILVTFDIYAHTRAHIFSREEHIYIRGIVVLSGIIQFHRECIIEKTSIVLSEYLKKHLVLHVYVKKTKFGVLVLKSGHVERNK